MPRQIAEGLEKKFISDALTLSFTAFAENFRLIKTATDFVTLFTDAIQPGNCLTATVDDQLAGLLTFQTTERTFYDITFRDIHAKKTLFPSLLLFFNFQLFHTRVAQDELYIDSLVVTPAFRLQGIASALLNAIESSARAQEKCRISLHLPEKNLPAQRLYEKHGFQISNSHRLFFIPGCPKVLRMVKRIS